MMFRHGELIRHPQTPTGERRGAYELSVITSNAATDHRIKCHHVRYIVNDLCISN
jgi:hypothetical protein